MMAQSLHGFIYEIVDIPDHFEIGKLKDFCKRIVREMESVQSIRSPNFEEDFDNLEESQELQILDTKEGDEDESDVVCTSFYEQAIKSQPTFIFHLDTDSNNELTSSTLKLFDDFFQNVSFEIKSSKDQDQMTNQYKDDKQREEDKNVKSKKSRKKLTRRRIRKSFVHDQ